VRAATKKSEAVKMVDHFVAGYRPLFGIAPPRGTARADALQNEVADLKARNADADEHRAADADPESLRSRPLRPAIGKARLPNHRR